ncbi:hypothetical protein BASA62_009864 [Batrachochytrium salamandrivorans]|nr:hypothetical protein BASA62_009864 [Batrachochytrium salamandrivorans]
MKHRSSSLRVIIPVFQPLYTPPVQAVPNTLPFLSPPVSHVQQYRQYHTFAGRHVSMHAQQLRTNPCVFSTKLHYQTLGKRRMQPKLPMSKCIHFQVQPPVSALQAQCSLDDPSGAPIF